MKTKEEKYTMLLLHCSSVNNFTCGHKRNSRARKTTDLNEKAKRKRRANKRMQWDDKSTHTCRSGSTYRSL